MNFLFGEKKTLKQQARDAKRDIGRGVREIGRDERKLKQEEKKLQRDIKECLKRGDKRSATTLAKALVKNRHMQERIVGSKANMTSMKYEVSNMATQAKMAEVMGTTAKVMKNMNEAAGVKKTAKVGEGSLTLSSTLDRFRVALHPKLLTCPLTLNRPPENRS